jgi:FlaA1/EpsC-like NDP-sugar epimerase
VNNKSSLSLAAYAGKRILITGAGGFIGSALTAALAAASPQSLVLLDNSEQNLHEMDLAQPEIIFHAAACKHVPLMEKNPLAAIRTNGIATWRLMQAITQAPNYAAKNSRAPQVLLISTDKAVKPASVMGATKRVAELALERMSSSGMTLQTVRLGNVLGSHGSVAPLFAQQIARGGPVTVTHPEVERYFFTLDDTIEIILRAASLGSGTFIPAPVPPLKIAVLAERMIREARSEGSGEIPIIFTEMRAGDKLREEFLNAAELAENTNDQRLLRVRGPHLNAEQFDGLMPRLDEAVAQRQLGAAVDVLRQLVPEYRPSEVLLERLHQASVANA